MSGSHGSPARHAASAHSVRDYGVVTLSYWIFTLTDGALRMLVLLYLHQLGYSPVTIASMFVFYEFFGVVTNFIGGWLGARLGLKATLFSGLALQLSALVLLGLAAHHLTVALLMVAQALSGIAKDLTKMSAKSYVKLVVPESDPHGLMRWVAILTGSKNTLKGVGFFLGGLLLQTVGFRGAMALMSAGIFGALVVSFTLLPKAPGRAAPGQAALRSLLSNNERVNWLSAARLFLFASRDVWFVLALPIFLQQVLGWAFAEVGAFLALWVMGYGLVQASTPAILRGRNIRRHPPDARGLAGFTTALVVPLAGIVLALQAGLAPTPTLIVGLALFGVVFAIDSAIHSYLILSYAESEQVTLRVGFYYMANAAGRLLGTVLSGAAFQAAGEGQKGLVVCVATSIGLVLLSAILSLPLIRAERRHRTSTAGPLDS